MMSLKGKKFRKSAVGFLMFDAGNDLFVPEVEVCPLAFTSTQTMW